VSGATPVGPRPGGTGKASATVAMVGAGQLARMTHQAAISLGIELRVLAAGPGDCALAAGATGLLAGDDPLADLRELADGADVLTFDHEQIDPELLRRLEDEGVRLAPGAAAKLFAQDKLHARRELERLGFPLPPFAAAESLAEIEDFAGRHSWPLVAKAPRGGYDGRGVAFVEGAEDAARVLEEFGGTLLLEPRLDLERELAVLVARSESGEVALYPVVETVQADGMCREILAPAELPEGLARQAGELGVGIAEGIGAIGILAVELFLTGDGLLVNELALRPHNSGHYSIEGIETSQFEQHLRAVLGWPLGPTGLCGPAVVTVNLVGPPDGTDPRTLLGREIGAADAHVHLYGKDASPGRKLGHVTAVADDLQVARERARHLAERLGGLS
jgi:5-(carboxyamino)imidazole ribonucleotide synthase